MVIEPSKRRPVKEEGDIKKLDSAVPELVPAEVFVMPLMRHSKTLGGLFASF